MGNLPLAPDVIAASLTAFDVDGGLDISSTMAGQAYSLANGVNAVMVAGTTGEWGTLTVGERRALMQASLNRWGPDRVIAHVGARTLLDTVSLLDSARALGAKRVAVITPFSCTDDQQAVVDWFEAVTDRADGLEVLAYIFPAITDTQVEPSTLAHMAQLPGMTGAKVSIPGAKPISTYRAVTPATFALYSGSDAALAQVYRVGGAGVVSGTSTVAPGSFVELANAIGAGDRSAECHAQDSVDRWTNALAGQIALMKAALGMAGLGMGGVRGANGGPSAESLGRLRQLLQTHPLPIRSTGGARGI